MILSQTCWLIPLLLITLLGLVPLATGADEDKAPPANTETQEADCLLKAIAATDRQNTSGAEEAISIRVALLINLAAYYDATYDLNPPPPVRSHVMPPMGYNTGVPPELVTDPNLREDYARRIEENRINSQRHKIQTAIRRLMAKVVDLSLNAERGDCESVVIRLQDLEIPQEMLHAMQALAQESNMNPAGGNKPPPLRPPGAQAGH